MPLSLGADERAPKLWWQWELPGLWSAAPPTHALLQVLERGHGEAPLGLLQALERGASEGMRIPWEAPLDRYLKT